MLEARDWFQFVGTLVAALVGVAGLAIVLGVESSSRYKSGLDSAIADVISGLAMRVLELKDYRVGHFPHFPGGMLGGPSGAGLKSLVDIAVMAGNSHRDRLILSTLSETVGSFGEASLQFQVDTLPSIGDALRDWRISALSTVEALEKLRDLQRRSIEDRQRIELRREEADRASDAKAAAARAAKRDGDASV